MIEAGNTRLADDADWNRCKEAPVEKDPDRCVYQTCGIMTLYTGA